MWARTCDQARHALRRLGARSGLSWFALGVSGAVTAVLYALVATATLTVQRTPDAMVYLLAAMGAGLVGSVVVFATDRRGPARVALVVRAATLIVISRSASLGLLPVVLLSVPFVLDIGISEAHPSSLVWGVAAAAIVALAYHGRVDGIDIAGVLVVEGQSVLGRIMYFITVGTMASVFSLASRYREGLIVEQRHADRLDGALKRLAEANVGYQEYLNRAEQTSMLEERRRITRDIHDTIGYTMTSNIMMMEAAAEMVRRDPAGVEQLMQKARESAQEGLDEIRNALHLLRAQEEPRPTSTEAILKMLTVFREATDTEIELELGNAPNRLESDIESAVYHVIREALTNSFRHGKATRVRVQFWRTESDLTVTVWDNGIGSEEIHDGIGLSGMRERLRAISGTLRVETLPTGFQIVATIPDRADARAGLS